MAEPSSTRNLLIIADAADWAPAPEGRAGEWDLRTERCFSLAEAQALPAADWDVVVFRTELLRELPPEAALDLLRSVARDATFLPVTAAPDPKEALYYLKHGAYEYLEEPLSAEAFLRALADAVENRETFREILALNLTLEAQKEQLLQEKQELERKNRELEAVSRLSRALASTLEIAEIVQHLADGVRDTFDCSRVVVGLVDSAGSAEEVRIVWDRPGEEPAGERRASVPGRWSLREGRRNPWMRTVLGEGLALTVAAPSLDPAVKDTVLARVHPNAFVKMPMVAQGRIVGSVTAESLAGRPPLNGSELEILRIFADTTAIAVENARLYHTMKELSVRDELTGVFNRRHLLRQLEAEWNHANRHGMPLSLLMVDIDHFKRLNDGNDHMTGDAALRQVAALLLRNTRGIDTVARYGGEEFVVLLPRATKDNARAVAEKLRRVIEAGEFEGEHAVPGGVLTVSVGAAGYPEDAADPHSLLERADWALYQAKARGRNRVCLWEEDLRRAETA